MAAYAATITVDTPRANRIGNTPTGLISGTCNLTNYNSTLAEITAITGKFAAAPRVVADGISSNGYIIKWDTTGKAFKAYRGPTISVANPTVTTTTNATTTDPVYTVGGALTQTTGAAGITGVIQGAVTGSQAAMTEVANDVNVGTFNFMATGRL